MNKNRLKPIVDALMLAGLLALMMFQVVGETGHRWLGLAMLALFVFHNGLNRAWYKNLFKGRYSASRMLITAVDLALAAAIILQGFSGLMLSRYVFSWLPLPKGTSAARLVHLAGAYWGFALMSMHIGLHAKSPIGRFLARRSDRQSRLIKPILSIGAWLMALAGVYFIWKNRLFSYMFLKNEFVFFDYSQPPLEVLIEVLCMLFSWAALAAWLQAGCVFRKIPVRKTSKKQPNKTTV